MQRTGFSFTITPATPGPGNLFINIVMHTWTDSEITESDVILGTRLYDVPERGDTDPLIYAEQMCDEIYKRINELRAQRADTGWISGAGDLHPRASETVTPEM